MKKLQLKKDVVARLNNDRMNQVKGGAVISTECPPIYPKTTDPLKCAVIQTSPQQCIETGWPYCIEQTQNTYCDCGVNETRYNC